MRLEQPFILSLGVGYYSVLYARYCGSSPLLHLPEEVCPVQSSKNRIRPAWKLFLIGPEASATYIGT